MAEEGGEGGAEAAKDVQDQREAQRAQAERQAREAQLRQQREALQLQQQSSRDTTKEREKKASENKDQSKDKDKEKDKGKEKSKKTDRSYDKEPFPNALRNADDEDEDSDSNATQSSNINSNSASDHEGWFDSLLGSREGSDKPISFKRPDITNNARTKKPWDNPSWIGNFLPNRQKRADNTNDDSINISSRDKDKQDERGKQEHESEVELESSADRSKPEENEKSAFDLKENWYNDLSDDEIERLYNPSTAVFISGCLQWEGDRIKDELISLGVSKDNINIIPTQGVLISLEQTSSKNINDEPVQIDIVSPSAGNTTDKIQVLNRLIAENTHFDEWLEQNTDEPPQALRQWVENNQTILETRIDFQIPIDESLLYLNNDSKDGDLTRAIGLRALKTMLAENGINSSPEEIQQIYKVLNWVPWNSNSRSDTIDTYWRNLIDQALSENKATITYSTRYGSLKEVMKLALVDPLPFDKDTYEPKIIGPASLGALLAPDITHRAWRKVTEITDTSDQPLIIQTPDISPSSRTYVLYKGSDYSLKMNTQDLEKALLWGLPENTPLTDFEIGILNGKTRLEGGGFRISIDVNGGTNGYIMNPGGVVSQFVDRQGEVLFSVGNEPGLESSLIQPVDFLPMGAIQSLIFGRSIRRSSEVAGKAIASEVVEQTGKKIGPAAGIPERAASTFMERGVFFTSQAETFMVRVGGEGRYGMGLFHHLDEAEAYAAKIADLGEDAIRDQFAMPWIYQVTDPMDLSKIEGTIIREVNIYKVAPGTPYIEGVVGAQLEGGTVYGLPKEYPGGALQVVIDVDKAMLKKVGNTFPVRQH
jgi:hypothetical protein